MVTCGVRSRGVDGPNAPIELGKKTWQPYWRAGLENIVEAAHVDAPGDLRLLPASADSNAAR